ncbi:hypothetical protein GCM10010313_71830 [Streptomyces violarus]|nr:hypothetical protein GCM10010313_71830 [Streptomyces violarus]
METYASQMNDSGGTGWASASMVASAVRIHSMTADALRSPCSAPCAAPAVRPAPALAWVPGSASASTPQASPATTVRVADQARRFRT